MEDFDLILNNKSSIELVADLIDSVKEEMPIAGKLLKIRNAYTSFRDERFIRKIETLLHQVLKLEAAQIGFVIDNLRAEHGADYFNEALFNAVEKSDSQKRTKILGNLIVLCANGKVSLKLFWALEHAISQLTMSDLKSLNLLAFIIEGLRGTDYSSSELEDWLKDNITGDRVLRYQSIGLVNVDSASQMIEYVNEVMYESLLACIED